MHPALRKTGIQPKEIEQREKLVNFWLLQKNSHSASCTNKTQASCLKKRPVSFLCSHSKNSLKVKVPTHKKTNQASRLKKQEREGERENTNSTYGTHTNRKTSRSRNSAMKKIKLFFSLGYTFCFISPFDFKRHVV